MIELATVELPRFGIEETRPEIPVEVYQARLTATVECMRHDGLDFLVVYGDREHFANLAYLTGFDPRFEESLLLLDRKGHRLLIVGNECMGYLPDERLGCDVALFQEFSLMGQPRGSSRPLRNIFADFGIHKGATVGCTGWKYFDGALIENGPNACDLPSYIVDLLRSMAAADRNVLNATGIFMDPAAGLRVINEPEQIVAFEYASIRTSEAMLAFIGNLREGVQEQELERLFDGAGLPLSCHRMISFGEKVRRGLASPSPNRARLGDTFTAAFGVTGALTCRAGCVARGPEDLPTDQREFYSHFAANYFDVVATWYEQVRVGAVSGDVFRAVDACRDDRLYAFAVNPGHLLHLDEWVHSPFSTGGRVELRSGMALQMDIIPVSEGPFYYINGEDGIVLADAALRDALAARWPACWKRIQARREFMHNALGIDLHESVLPLSNIPGWLPPFALSRDKILVKRI